MLNIGIIFIFLAVFWYAMSGQEYDFYLISGLASCMFVTWLAIRLKLHEKIRVNRYIFPYKIWLIGQIFISSFYVLKKIWSVKPALSPNFIELGKLPKQEIFYAIYANSITLTPGTV